MLAEYLQTTVAAHAPAHDGGTEQKKEANKSDIKGPSKVGCGQFAGC
jgi:hypothetical protein